MEKNRTVKNKALSGATWTIFFQGGSMVIRFTNNIILARLLLPEAFGLMAIVNILFVGIHLLSDTGVFANIVRNPKSEDPDFCNSMWTIQVIRGFFLCLLCLIFAKPVALLYGEPALTQLIMAMSIGVLFSGFQSTSIPILHKRLLIKWVYLLELITQVLSIVIMIIWTIMSPTVWGLLVGLVSSEIMRSVGSHFILPNHKNRLRWDYNVIREATNFGKWIFLSTALSFLSNQADRLLLGKLMSVQVLGVYHIALQLIQVPYTLTLQLAGKILYPLMSQVYQEDKNELNNKIIKMKQLMLPSLVCIFLSIMVMSKAFFEILYKKSYHDASWMVGYLGFMVWFEVIILLIERVPLVLGESKILAFKSTFSFFARFSLCLIGFYLYEMIGLVIGLALGSALTYIFLVYLLSKHNINPNIEDIKFTTIFFLLFVAYKFLSYFFFQQSFQNFVFSLSFCAAVNIVILKPWNFKKKVINHLSNTKR